MYEVAARLRRGEAYNPPAYRWRRRNREPAA